MGQVFTGALAMGFGIITLFFFRFWRETQDRLFGFFALAFAIQAASRLWLAFITPQDLEADYPYWMRFLAFAMILLAIVEKNMARKSVGS